MATTRVRSPRSVASEASLYNPTEGVVPPPDVNADELLLGIDTVLRMLTPDRVASEPGIVANARAYLRRVAERARLGQVETDRIDETRTGEWLAEHPEPAALSAA